MKKALIIIITISIYKNYPKYFSPSIKNISNENFSDNYKENENPEKCFCDITRNFCDKNCCCDLDCKKKEISNFKFCLEKKKERNLIRNKCEDFQEEKFGFEFLDFYFEESFVKNSIFCLKKKNLPDFEEFFEKIDDVSFEVKEKILLDKENSFYFLDRDYLEDFKEEENYAVFFLSFFLGFVLF